MTRTAAQAFALATVCLPTCVVAHDWQYTPLMTTDNSLKCDANQVNHSKIVVAAVGDSITVGATCGEWSGGFVKVLQDALGDDYDVRDCGVCGHDAVRENHGNIRHATYWQTNNHNNSKLMAPDVVIYMLGTNDADEWYNTSVYYEQDMKDLISEYINLESKPKVHTMIPPPLSNYSCAENPNPTCLSPFSKSCTIDCVLPKLVPKITAELGLPAPVDLLSFLGGPTETNKTAMPGLHPNCNGYNLIGHYLAEVLFQVGSSVLV